MKSVILILATAVLVTGCIQDSSKPVVEDENDGPIRYVRNSAFTGPNLEVFIEFDDGRRGTVNSLDDAIDTRQASTPMPGHQARDWTFLKETEHGTSVVFALTSWDPAAPDDYIMAGWWAEFPDQQLPDLDLNGAVTYGIVDGPEIDTRYPPELPVEGQASYRGQAGGLYGYLAPGAPDEDFVLEEYEGTITLSADFAERTLQGCVGCEGDLVSQRKHFNFFLGDEQGSHDGTVIADYEIHLGAAPPEENGTFGSYDVTVKNPETQESGVSTGHWGGSVSNIFDADGNPTLVSGFTGVHFEGDGGTWAGFFGSFLALSERYRASGE